MKDAINVGFSINFSGRQESLMMSSVICDHWLHFKIVQHKFHDPRQCVVANHK